MIRSIKVPEGRTDEGEDAPEISVQEELGAFYIVQLHERPGGGIKCSMVGMSRDQAKKVRDTLNRLLEPII